MCIQHGTVFRSEKFKYSSNSTPNGDEKEEMETMFRFCLKDKTYKCLSLFYQAKYRHFQTESQTRVPGRSINLRQNEHFEDRHRERMFLTKILEPKKVRRDGVHIPF